MLLAIFSRSLLVFASKLKCHHSYFFGFTEISTISFFSCSFISIMLISASFWEYSSLSLFFISDNLAHSTFFSSILASFILENSSFNNHFLPKYF
ncbi:MAG: hypothetical protein BWY04_00573 [candidate division CPR1 bacterium ADurb.Bin160]|uniref:Uncharacterized protein n=1 Tax=candidate division CPR1 bacterium ADurb.Bin160 TaxID=1852826 RepID=A0A1V5ZNQ7_9BACT|nr:MAG: hypothetical protein BWY04_00573 [candidate division CPR1 bacterium ADurb.Bin160]